ncbi:MAG TPA: adenylyltransferase/cytidyltransferase family protein [Candidatus Saccharimonadales bacterium]|nr:adenylyltransferase/cytidyltransferase family protein [Candidatus Saccharimonadales bacterium]
MSNKTTGRQVIQSNRGVFSDAANSSHRFIPDYERLSEMITACKTIGLKVVLAMGTFDIIHIGHFLYLEKAHSYGDVLVVGVDSDEKVKARKGPSRPIVPEDERVTMLTHVRNVDIVTLKPASSPKWTLIKLVRPDVLIATAETYTKKELEALEEYCGRVVVLEPQATTSTTAKLRRIHIGLAKKMKAVIAEAVEASFDKLSEGEV